MLLAMASDVSAQSDHERSIVFHPERTETYHRPQRKIGRPQFAPPPKKQSHTNGRSEFVNVNVTNNLNFDQNEPFVAINPTDPTNIVAGANDYRTEPALWSYTSTDAGANWLNQELPRATTLALATDPGLAFDRNGKLFYSNGRFDVFGIPFPRNEVVVYRSDNKGLTWDLPTRPFYDTASFGSAQVLSDKYFIAIDRGANSGFKDRIYVVWTEYQVAGARIVGSFSTNGGATWSSRVYISGVGNYTAPAPAVAPNGDLYVTWIDKSASKQILIARSTNGGAAFSSPVKVTNYKDLGPVVPPGNPNERPYVKDHVGVNSFPSIAIDHSSKFNGRVFVSWASKDDAGVPHIYVSSSSNSGQAWSTPQIAEANPSSVNTDRFFNWIAVDPSNGDVGLIYYDSRIDSINNHLIDAFYSHSTDGGLSFRSVRVSTESFDPHITDAYRVVDTVEFAFFGDYIGLDVLNRNWRAVWTDSRPGNDQEIFTAQINPYAPHSVDDLSIAETEDEYPLLSWTYTPGSVLGYTITNHSFRIRRSDGEEFTAAGNVREYLDETVEAGVSYTYYVSAISAEGESIERNARFVPIRSRKPKPVELVTSVASEDGFTITMRLPEQNEFNRNLEGLDSLLVLVDGELREGLKISDAYKGTEQTRAYLATPDSFHKLQVLVSTSRDGFRTYSDTSTAFLYAGNAVTDYDDDFEQDLAVFTPFAWSKTQGTPFTSSVLNDSVRDVNYDASVHSWFLVRPVRVNQEARSLEFDHIALINQIDLGLVEASLNNGVTYQPLAQYNVTAHAQQWGTSLSNSSMVHEALNLAQFMDSSVIVRFRLVASTGGLDGWFVDNLSFTNLASVRPAANVSALSVYPNPLRIASTSNIRFTPEHEGRAMIRVIDMLGRTVVKKQLRVHATDYTIPLSLDEAGAYVLELTIESSGMTSCSRERIVVLPR